MLDAAGDAIRALYVAGSFLPEHLEGREDALAKLDFLVVQELFENETTAAADVVLPAASYAEAGRHVYEQRRLGPTRAAVDSAAAPVEA